MQNKNKSFVNPLKIQLFSLPRTRLYKGLVNLLFITLCFKVLLVGTLFLLGESSYAAAENTVNAHKLIELTNHEREKAGLPQLVKNPLLTRAARAKAYDILTQDYFAHTTPDRKPFYIWIQEAGYVYTSAGENLAISFIDENEIMNAWMASQTHKDNILDTQYTEIGIASLIGDFSDKETIVVVQLFGEPIHAAAAPLQADDAPLTLGETYEMYAYKKGTLSTSLSFMSTLVTIILIAVLTSIASLLIMYNIQLKNTARLETTNQHTVSDLSHSMLYKRPSGHFFRYRNPHNL